MQNLFNSYTNSIPPLRHDLQVISIEQNGKPFLYFHDSLGYATPNLIIPAEAEAILSLMDGNRSVNDILKFSSEEVSKEQIMGYIQFLDEHALLSSVYFSEHAELVDTQYEKSNIHTCFSAGSSYPDTSPKLSRFLDDAFQNYEQSPPVKTAKGLYAPHIDPRVGLKSYVKAFSSIKKLTPKRVVILATSHYSGMFGELYQDSPFVISNKTFSMPNGEVSTDQQKYQVILNSFQDLSMAGVSNYSRAHRIEHSIELHLLFLNHIWKHDFEIVPILVGGFDELFYSNNSFREQQLDSFSSLLRNEFENDEETFFLISGDLSHFGKKFGDACPASEMFSKVKINDERFLNIGASGNPDKLISLMKEEFDSYRICGFPPLLTFLKTFRNISGKVLSHDLWDEQEQESAVTFGSILYR